MEVEKTMSIYQDIAENLMEGQTAQVRELTQKAVDEGKPAVEILNNALLAGMNEVGELFKEGEMFVPEVLIAAKAMNSGMEIIKPLLNDGDIKKAGTVIMATVKGDLHDIGLNLVSMMLEGAGFEVINLGIDTEPEKIIEAIKQYNPDIIGMSAMLTTTMKAMKEAVQAIKEAGLYDKVKVMVGGAPVNDEFAQQIGAHYSSDANEAVEVATRLVSA